MVSDSCCNPVRWKWIEYNCVIVKYNVWLSVGIVSWPQPTSCLYYKVHLKVHLVKWTPVPWFLNKAGTFWRSLTPMFKFKVTTVMILHCLLCSLLASLVPRPHPKRRRGSGDIGTDSWFCKLSNHVITCIGLYWSTCDHVMVRTTKKMPAMSPDPFLTCVVGSGNKSIF